ncbi:MAG: hypothetical protein Q7P63_04800 [Verrucomicrobiota bacterium JB022]|nr:hypothetical protein [Verrucomicrobiota bacterium JB022]
MESAVRILAFALMLSPTWAFVLDHALFAASFDSLTWGLGGLGLALLAAMLLPESVRTRTLIALAFLLAGLLQIGLISVYVLGEDGSFLAV